MPWTEDSYGELRADGAAKLADSAVAPLVAQARGYWTADDRDSVKQMATRATAAAVSQTTLVRQLNALVAGEDDNILVMPWYSLERVMSEGTLTKSYNTQYRPSRPMQNNGKPIKYSWFKGEGMVLDLHPATPLEWIDSSVDLMMAEGLLKGDAALTGYLLDGGFASLEELSQVFSSVEDARRALNTIMSKVPQAQRMPVISTASSTTWLDQASQWRHISFKERRVILAFDGDVATNPRVYREAKKAMKFFADRKAKPRLLAMWDLDVENAKMSSGAFSTSDKIGVDDYLSHVGSWGDLKRVITHELPPEPEGKTAPLKAGDWRVLPENDAIVEEAVQEKTAEGDLGPVRWVPRYHVGGRILATEARRRPTHDERKTGVIDDSQQMMLEDSGVEIEIALLDPEATPDERPSYYKVTGPAALLSASPKDWVRHARQLPNEVLAHADWPPRKGDDWLSAVKAHRRDETSAVVSWSTMGWVPVADSNPAFIVGQQVLGCTPEDEERTKVGVTDHEVADASSFGVIDTYRDLSLDRYRAQVASDIRTVVTTFIENGFWKDEANAVSILAAMLRPTIPVRPNITLYFVGPKRSGKSYSASYVLSGWQHTPGTWHEKHLNGDAGDTMAATEHAISRTPLWVVDDLAPRTDRRKAEEQSTMLENIIRAVFNGSGRRRMDGRTMTQREVPNPVALLVITAENPPQIESIKDRIISIYTPPGGFNDKNDRWAERQLKAAVADGAPARLVAAMIRLWQRDDTGLGATWAERVATAEEMVKAEEETAIAVLEEDHGIRAGESTRRASQVASLGVSLSALYELALWAGIDKDDPILAKFGAGEGTYMSELYMTAKASIEQARNGTPGRALIAALAKLLASGRAHLRNPTTPGAPPVTARGDDVGGVEVAALNESLGWDFDASRNTWVGRGQPIGYFGENASGEDVCLFDTTNAFREAKAVYPDLIPYGMTASSSWESVWDERLVITSAQKSGNVASRMMLGASRYKGDGTEETVDTSGGSARRSGVPVSLDALQDALGIV